MCGASRLMDIISFNGGLAVEGVFVSLITIAWRKDRWRERERERQKYNVHVLNCVYKLK